jgi:D-threonate/D-erythronate kinase
MDRASQSSEPGAPRVILVADDLTGAADSGVAFAAYGANVLVVWDTASIDLATAPFADIDVLAISTESRHRSAEAAVRQVEMLIAPLLEAWHRPPIPLIYKKIDSTLRGHPGVELAALLRCINARPASSGAEDTTQTSQVLIAPAFPAQGRVTRGGVHYVYGMPVARTVFGEGMTSSRVRDFFPASSDRLRFADAESDADLIQCVDDALASDTRIFCGSAGLANALAGRLAQAWAWSPLRSVGPRVAERAVLVVAASRHSQTRRQLAFLRTAGVPILTPSLDWIPTHQHRDDKVLVPALIEALTSGTAVLTTSGLPDLPISGSTLVAHLAEAAVAALLAIAAGATAHDASGSLNRGLQHPCTPLPPDRFGLVLTGGDTAIAVSQALEADALRLNGEVTVGMPWGRLVGGHGAGLCVVTKAGGFGDRRALATAVDFLRGADDD